MTTNGTLLTGKKLDFVLKHNFHLGVSLDGTREAHDLFRRYPGGRSSHSRIARHIREAVKRYPALEVIAVVDPQNAHLVDESFAFINGLGVRDLTFNMNYEGDWTDEACDRLEAALRPHGTALPRASTGRPGSELQSPGPPRSSPASKRATPAATNVTSAATRSR